MFLDNFAAAILIDTYVLVFKIFWFSKYILMYLQSKQFYRVPFCNIFDFNKHFTFRLITLYKIKFKEK